MWFEIIPSAAIITVALSVPIYAMYGLQKLTLGNVSVCCSKTKFLYNILR